MRAVQFGLSHFAAVAGLALLSYCIGRRLTSRFVYHSHLEELSFSVALGIGTIAYGVFFLGLFDLLYKWVALAALGAGLAACYQVWLGFLLGLWKQGFKLGKAIKRKTVIVAAVVLLVITLARPIWILPLYPPTAFDSTMYHLTLAKVYVQRHGLLLTPYLRLATSTQTNQMLFTLALLIYDDILAQLIQFLIMLTLSTALIAFGERFFAFRAGFWAAAMLLSKQMCFTLLSVYTAASLIIISD